MAGWSISATLALSAQIFLHRRAQTPGWRWVVLSAASLLVFGVQLARGIEILVTPDDRSALTWIAVIGVLLSAIGIARAWELLGAQTLGLMSDFRRWRRSHGHPGQ
jgi:protein-S-isoprenylcysteine O-methyltransferase Ste14